MSKAVEADLIVGVDTHLDTHTAALCDARGRGVLRPGGGHRRGIRPAAGMGGQRGCRPKRSTGLREVGGGGDLGDHVQQRVQGR